MRDGDTLGGRDASRAMQAVAVVAILVVTAILSTWPSATDMADKSLSDSNPVTCLGANIMLDSSTTHQTITGWSATAWAAQDSSPAFDNYSDELFDLAINDLGLNRLRVPVRAGVENSEDYWKQYMNGTVNYSVWRSHRYTNVNDNGDPNVINWSGFHFSELDDTLEKVVLPMKQVAGASGINLHINVIYVAFTAQNGPGLQYIHDDPDEYAEFVLATHLHLQSNYSIVPDTWEVILEPDNVAQWNGNLIGQAIVATAQKLEAYGFTTRFVAPSNTNMGNAITYFDAMIAVPGVVGNLTEFSYHRYGGVSDANLRAIASRANTYGVNTSMLEHIGSGYQDLYKDLTIANNSAWMQFTLAGPGPSDPGGKYFLIDEADPANPIVSMGWRTKFLRQYFRYVRRGAVRIGATTDDLTFEPAAFVNADNGTVVVVNAGAGGNFTVHGLPPGVYGISYTTSAQYDMHLPDVTIGVNDSLVAGIPASGVATIFSQHTGPPIVQKGILSGPGMANVRMHWLLSPDDGAGLNSVVRYDIFRGTVYDSAGTGYLFVTSVPNGTALFEDLMRGEGDPSNYFYRVCAVDSLNYSACADQQAGKFTRPLSSGVNLVSVPLVQADVMLGDVLTTLRYDKAWSYDPVRQEWNWYMRFKIYRKGLYNLNHTVGLWVNVTEDSNLTVAGVVPAQTAMHLHKGWNLVSFPSFLSYSVSDLKAVAPVERVEGFDSLASPHFLGVLADSDVLLAGQGYWVKTSADATWVVSNT